MLVHAPAAGFEAEVGEHELRRLERPVAVAQRRPHAGVAEADDVGPAVAGDVGEEARVLLDPPTAGLEPEVRQHELWIGEESAALAERRPHSGVPEPDDVGAAVAGDVGQEARVPIDPPAPRSVPVRALLDLAEVTRTKEDGEVVGECRVSGSSLEKLPKKRMNTQSVGSDGSSDGRFWTSGR